MHVSDKGRKTGAKQLPFFTEIHTGYSYFFFSDQIKNYVSYFTKRMPWLMFLGNLRPDRGRQRVTSCIGKTIYLGIISYFHTSETKERCLCALPHQEIHCNPGARACMRRGHHAGLYLYHRPKPCISLHSDRKHNLLEKNLQVKNSSPHH